MTKEEKIKHKIYQNEYLDKTDEDIIATLGG